MSYSEDFRRKILEIFSDFIDNLDRMKKLFEVVIEVKGKGIINYLKLRKRVKNLIVYNVYSYYMNYMLLFGVCNYRS